MSRQKIQKAAEVIETYHHRPGITVDEANRKDIDRVIEIIGMLPGLRRYGGEEAALEEAKAALQRVKERL